MIWAAFFICGFLCTSSQYLYVKESDRCTSSGKTMVQIRELLLQQERIQKSVDSLRQMVKRLEENTGKIHEDVEMVKRGLKLHTDCQDYYVHGHKESGVYLIDPFGNSSLVTVFCDTETEGGGWTTDLEKCVHVSMCAEPLKSPRSRTRTIQPQATGISVHARRFSRNSHKNNSNGQEAQAGPEH
ncbi:fibrinogen-like protein 1 [Saccostrea cucullata]|uniref:fibrinogen-like protein 1 n=1 Tax=Saccostrea cuccullata TaxID=36930 RepID=UPI002ED029AD